MNQCVLKVLDRDVKSQTVHGYFETYSKQFLLPVTHFVYVQVFIRHINVWLLVCCLMANDMRTT